VLTEKCEAERAEVRRRRQEMEDEVAGVRRDWEETRRQMEEDVDTEIEKLKRKCVIVCRGVGVAARRCFCSLIASFGEVLACVTLDCKRVAVQLRREPGGRARVHPQVQGRQRHHEEEVLDADEGGGGPAGGNQGARRSHSPGVPRAVVQHASACAVLLQAMMETERELQQNIEALGKEIEVTCLPSARVSRVVAARRFRIV
jgi:hypothetical protein